jgi:toxin-antitoxin system PIN domain toxin
MDAVADVNVVFALVNERHGFHRRACSWLDRQDAGFRLGICRLVQMALIRLLCNEKAMDGDPLTLPQAWKLYADLIKDPAFGFLPEPKGFQAAWIDFCQPYGASPKVLSDAYLAAISTTTGLPLATFDRDFSNFPGLGLLAISSRRAP